MVCPIRMGVIQNPLPHAVHRVRAIYSRPARWGVTNNFQYGYRCNILRPVHRPLDGVYHSKGFVKDNLSRKSKIVKLCKLAAESGHTHEASGNLPLDLMWLVNSRPCLSREFALPLSYQIRFPMSFSFLQIKQIEEYMQYRNVPTDTKKRISNYFEHKYHQGRYFDETEIMSVIGKPLRAVCFSFSFDHS